MRSKNIGSGVRRIAGSAWDSSVVEMQIARDDPRKRAMEIVYDRCTEARMKFFDRGRTANGGAAFKDERLVSGAR